MKNKIAVLGAGSWGTTLAILLAKKKLDVKLWEFNEEQALILRQERENKTFLAGVNIPQSILISSSIEEVLNNVEVIVIAVPSHAVREVAKKIKSITSQDSILVSVAKGIENNSLARMSEVIKEETNSNKIVVLSGPSHAEEVSREVPTAIVAASENLELAEEIQDLFITDYFRVYTNVDVIGVEISGSLKNIIAIGTGIIDGLKLGDNTKAALITRGLAEISRFGKFFGGLPMTFSGLSGVGDLAVTCMSKHSRNRLIGEKIGSGKTLQAALNEMVMVAEGVKTTLSVYELSRKNNIEMPITEQIYEVLYNNKSPKEALNSLMTREARYEFD